MHHALPAVLLRERGVHLFKWTHYALGGQRVVFSFQLNISGAANKTIKRDAESFA
jgi:hypothetical protein